MHFRRPVVARYRWRSVAAPRTFRWHKWKSASNKSGRAFYAHNGFASRNFARNKGTKFSTFGFLRPRFREISSRKKLCLAANGLLRTWKKTLIFVTRRVEKWEFQFLYKMLRFEKRATNDDSLRKNWLQTRVQESTSWQFDPFTSRPLFIYFITLHEITKIENFSS